MEIIRSWDSSLGKRTRRLPLAVEGETISSLLDWTTSSVSLADDMITAVRRESQGSLSLKLHIWKEGIIKSDLIYWMSVTKKREEQESRRRRRWWWWSRIIFCPSMKTMLISTDVVKSHTILNKREQNASPVHSIEPRLTSARADWAWKKTASLPRHLGPAQKRNLFIASKQTAPLDLQGCPSVRGKVGSEITSVTIWVNSLEKRNYEFFLVDARSVDITEWMMLYIAVTSNIDSRSTRVRVGWQ